MHNNIISKLLWRYATKAFDPEKKLSSQQVQMLRESLRLSPSSFGLQPWKFIEVRDPELRKKIRERSWNQPQTTEASNLLILCARTNLNEEHINAHINRIIQVQGTTAEALKEHKDMMLDSLTKMSVAERQIWAEKQVYIALGVLLTTAAINDIDACPMEGFDRNAVNELLGLSKQHLTAACICAVGYRKASDPAATRSKVRFEEKDVFSTLTTSEVLQEQLQIR